MKRKKPSQKENPEFEASLLHPRYWHIWFGFAIWWLITLLPYPFLIFLGKLVGWLSLLFAKSRKRIAKKNIELCFPEKTQKERNKILRQSFESAGIAIFEMGMGWWWPAWRLKNLCQIQGLEELEEDQQGVVLLAMHFTTLDLCGICFSLHYPFAAMYRPHKNPVYNWVQYRGRSRDSRAVIFPREDLRTMVKLLREGRIVWYAPDQDYGAQYSVFAPFFGIPAATITATSKLTTMGKAGLRPFTHERLSWCRGYRITIHPLASGLPSGDEQKDAEQVNAIVEREVAKLPGQYLWPHRRFKTRPEGEPSLYQ